MNMDVKGRYKGLTILKAKMDLLIFIPCIGFTSM